MCVLVCTCKGGRAGGERLGREREKDGDIPAVLQSLLSAVGPSGAQRTAARLEGRQNERKRGNAPRGV